jgi:hypothetical protein
MAGLKRVKDLVAAALILLLGACATPSAEEAGAVRSLIIRERIVFDRGAWTIVGAAADGAIAQDIALTAERER